MKRASWWVFVFTIVLVAAGLAMLFWMARGPMM